MSHALLEQIAAATAGKYEIIAELGQTSAGTAFLARDVEDGALVVLLVPPSADELAVFAAVGENVPASAGACTRCQVSLPTWSAACPRCGSRLTGEPGTSYTTADVQASAGDAYVVEGAIAHRGGGMLFFARDRVDHRLVALAPTRSAPGEEVLEAVWEQTAAADVPHVHAPTGGHAGYATGVAGRSVDDLQGAGASSWATPPSAVVGEEPPLVTPAPPRRRRGRSAVLAGLAVLLAGGGWIAWQGRASGRELPTIPTPMASHTLLAASGDSSASTMTGMSTGTVVPTAEPATLLRPDSVARAVVQIDGELPDGWTLFVNGRARAAIRAVRVTAGRSALIQVSHPGYCPDTVRLQLAPGATQPWTPRLRGRPMVGDC